MKWMFVAGGTGGHVFPALALAQMIQSLAPEDEVLFVGREGSIEHRLISEAGYSILFMNASGMNGSNFISKVKSFLLLAFSFLNAFKIIHSEKPQVVFGIGGYLSGAMLLVASFYRGTQTGILEPNARPGLANRILSKIVNKVFIAFEDAKSFFPSSKTIWSGNPLRKEILRSRSGRQNIKTLLVFGGSQGAVQVNDWFLNALPDILNTYPELRVIHQTGVKDFERVSGIYQNIDINVEVKPFFTNMAEVYEKSDLAIARSGSSILELCACGIPSILIPYPYAADSHQEANALELQELGGAVMLDSKKGSSENLKNALIQLLGDTQRFSKMSQASLKYRFENASQTIVESFKRSPM